ncbi:DUF4282 domain-containing protein [Blastopirellula retiformator]|uniref:GYF domain-containing protein n=1 Tax=Blastopirellula retiformator TaxID=2527970 RepID=A0A5C5V329_9BACT|nr:DUF4282 domain-containing protein [Blastopirellula retiformator]TWT32938.1 hypothetical protein Enr8_27540 [Blastopirellula retiformator]
MAEEFYLKANENAPETGPFSSKKMRQLAAAGQITPETLVRRGESSWVHATSVRGLELPSGPPPTVAPSTAAPVSTAGEVPMGIPVETPDEVKSSIPTSLDDDHGISLPSRLPDPTGGTGEAQVKGVGEEPRAFDEDAPTPPSITAPPPPPPAAPAAVAVDPPKEEEPEISEMISVAPSDKSSGKGKKKKGKVRAARAPSSGSSSGGGLGGLFSFKTMIAPSVIKIVFYVGLTLILLGWLGGTAALLLIGMFSGQPLTAAIGVAATYFVVGGVISLLKILLLRIGAEVVIAYFQAVEDLAAIRERGAEKV